jgi:hypothetical protein
METLTANSTGQKPRLAKSSSIAFLHHFAVLVPGTHFTVVEAESTQPQACSYTPSHVTLSET